MCDFDPDLIGLLRMSKAVRLLGLILARIGAIYYGLLFVMAFLLYGHRLRNILSTNSWGPVCYSDMSSTFRPSNIPKAKCRTTYPIRRLRLSRLLLGQAPRHPSPRIINNVLPISLTHVRNNVRYAHDFDTHHPGALQALPVS